MHGSPQVVVNFPRFRAGYGQRHRAIWLAKVVDPLCLLNQQAVENLPDQLGKTRNLTQELERTQH